MRTKTPEREQRSIQLMTTNNAIQFECVDAKRNRNKSAAVCCGRSHCDWPIAASMYHCTMATATANHVASIQKWVKLPDDVTANGQMSTIAFNVNRSITLS